MREAGNGTWNGLGREWGEKKLRNPERKNPRFGFEKGFKGTRGIGDRKG